MIKIFNLKSVPISIENSKPFTLFQTCSPCQIKTILCWHPVKPNLTRWSYSILTKPNPAQPNSIQYIVSYPNCNLDNYQLFQNFQYFSVAWKETPTPAKFQRCTEVHNCRNSKRTFAAQVYKLFSIYFFALTFEPKINIAKLFFAPFLFPRKTEQINCKKYTVKKSKMIFHDFFSSCWG